jgi:hypothetical protein
VYRGGFERLRGIRGPVVRYHGLHHLTDGELIDPASRETRHNLIIATHHRLGYLDLPLFFAPVRRFRLIIWANNAFYGPGLEAKIARDRKTIPVRGQHRAAMEEITTRTADLLVHARVPLFTFADGSQPPLFYGHQLRVKSGLRLAVNAALLAARGTGRRTYVLPMTLNDPVGFIQGMRDTVDVRFHSPLLVEEPWERARREDADPEEPVNGGDPLLNHLEALFIRESTVAVHGLPRPRIMATSHRRRASATRWGVRLPLPPTSIADLARQAATPPTP